MIGHVLYGIVCSKDAPSKELTGLLDHPVKHINFRDLTMIASAYEGNFIESSPMNFISYRYIVMELARCGPVIPLAFGILAPSEGATINLLKLNYNMIIRRLNYLGGKVQYFVRVVWSDMKKVFSEVVSENQDIRIRRDRLLKSKATPTLTQRIAIGQMVAQALDKKKATEAKTLKSKLQAAAQEIIESNGREDNTVTALDVLLNRNDESRFESNIDLLDQEAKGRYIFRLQGPEPPLSFSVIPLKVTAKVIA